MGKSQQETSPKQIFFKYNDTQKLAEDLHVYMNWGREVSWQKC